MSTYGVSLLSGGLDSTTVTAHARGMVDHLTSVTFRYGQVHAREVDAAREIAASMGISHRTVDISFLGEVAWYSALTSPGSFPIPGGRGEEEIGHGVPITYVPLRNTIFLSLGAALAESEALCAIEEQGEDPKDMRAIVYLAPNAIDYSGYPDCRPEFFQSAAETINIGSKLATEHGVRIEVETPIINLAKSEIVRMAMGLGVRLEMTWSCYRGGEIPCGQCDSCLLRARGFAEAGVSDPALTG